MLRHDIIYHDLIIVQSCLREIKKKKKAKRCIIDRRLFKITRYRDFFMDEAAELEVF